MTLEALAERIEALEAGTSARVVQTFSGTPIVAPVREVEGVSDVQEPAAAPPTSRSKAHEETTDVVPVEQDVPPLELLAAPTMTGAELDTAAAKRAWPAVVAEIRRVKATRAEMYGRVEVDVDADRHTLVLEFPADQEFAMQMAEEPDMRELLQRALGTVMGVAPPVRFQIGSDLPEPPAVAEAQAASRSSTVHGPSDDAVPAADDGEDEVEYFETKKVPHPWVGDEVPDPPADPPAAANADSAGDLTRRLMESLGAEIVDERRAGSGESGGPEVDDGAEPDLLELESSDFGLKDPELFDETDREGDS
jgi:hypothetical protein